MKVAVTGATGVLGRQVMPAMARAGHQIVAITSTEKAEQARSLGASTCSNSSMFDDDLAEAFDGCDAVCNLASHVPVGASTLLPWAWRLDDRLRTEGVGRVVAAAKASGVRRVVHASVSYLYADAGDEWITERHPLAISPATEPASVGESLVQEYTCRSRTGVVLRFGTVIGNDSMTRGHLRAMRNGRPIGVGDPNGWAHVVHGDDLGPAVLSALDAPSGVYNVGAAPVRRADLVQGYAEAVGRDHGDFVGRVMLKLSGSRAEPVSRSLRVSSSAFSGCTGWQPNRPEFDAAWLDAAVTSPVALSR